MTGFPFPGIEKPPPNNVLPPSGVGDMMRWAKEFYLWLNGFLSWTFTLSRIVNNLLAGKLLCTGDVTLTASATSTTLDDVRITAQSFIGLMPQTANAAAALSVTYVSARTNGQATISHPIDLSADRSYTYVIVG